MYLYAKEIKNEFNPFVEINSRLSSKEYNSFIYVVPTRRKIRYLTRELIEQTPDKTIPHLNLFTIGDLAEEIFKCKFTSFNKISDSLKYFIIKNLLTEIQTNYFTPHGKYFSNGLIELIAAVITRLKELGISNTDFIREVDLFEGYNRLKLDDISKIYNGYQNYLQKLGLYEQGDIYLTINNLNSSEIENLFRSIFPEVDFLLIAGFTEFTQPELKLIESLSKISNLESIITLDFTKDNLEIFENLLKTHDYLESIGFQFKEVSFYENSNEFNRAVKIYLFKEKPGEKIRVKNIFKFSGFDARDEVETIAKIIKHKVVQNPDLQLNKICIAIKGIKNYSNLVREIFYKFGIPVNVTDRYYLKNSPVVISIIRLLDLIRKNFFYKDLFYVLKSPYLDFSSIDVNNLRDTLELIKISRGKDEIIQTIDSRINYLKKLLINDESYVGIEIEKLEKAKIDFQKIVELLSQLRTNQTPEEFVSNLKSIIKNLRVYEKIFESKLPIDRDINITTYSKDIRALNLFHSILEELQYTFEKLNRQNQKFSLDTFFDFITTSIFGSRYNIKERWGYGVLVTTPEEIRGLKFDILFLPGLENGVFPQRYTPLIFLDEKYIINERENLLQDRYLFYQCLNAFEKELYLSYPQQDEKKEKIPSDFLIELEKIFTLQDYDKTLLDNFIFTNADLYTKLSIDELLELSINDKNLVAKISRVREALHRMQKRVENNINLNGKEFCGIITDEYLLSKLYSEFNDKYFSITDLETYAKCPFKYFIQYILRPEIEEEIEEEIQDFEFGKIIHSILLKFFTKLKNEKRNFYEELRSNLETLFNELFIIAQEEVKVYERFNPFFFLTEEIILGPKISGENGKHDITKSILYKFLELEKNVTDEFTPAEFEKELQVDFTINETKLKIKGKIDRIDVDEKKSYFKIIDYKTGKTPTNKDYEDKVSFQLPLYLKIVKEYFHSINKDLQIYDAEFIRLPRKKTLRVERESLRNEILKNKDFELELNEIIYQVYQIVERLKGGKFNLTTLEKFEERVCKYCLFKPICRIESIKKDLT